MAYRAVLERLCRACPTAGSNPALSVEFVLLEVGRDENTRDAKHHHAGLTPKAPRSESRPLC